MNAEDTKTAAEQEREQKAQRIEATLRSLKEHLAVWERQLQKYQAAVDEAKVQQRDLEARLALLKGASN